MCEREVGREGERKIESLTSVCTEKRGLGELKIEMTMTTFEITSYINHPSNPEVPNRGSALRSTQGYRELLPGAPPIVSLP